MTRGRRDLGRFKHLPASVGGGPQFFRKISVDPRSSAAKSLCGCFCWGLGSEDWRLGL